MGIRILNYLDDWLILAQSEVELLSTQNPHTQPLRPPGAQGQFRQTNIVPGYSSGLSSHESGDSARTRSGHSELAATFKSDTRPLKVFQRMLGLMSAASPVLQLGLLRMRPLQRWLKPRVPHNAWRHGRLHIRVNQACVTALTPWRNPRWMEKGVAMGLVHTRKVVTTDASNTGWIHRSNTESGFHINCLEMLAVCRACQFLLPDLIGRHVLIRSDNMSVVSYINHQGGVSSKRLFILAERLLEWAQLNLRSLRAAHWLSYWQQPPGPCPWDGISSLRRMEQYGTLDPSCGLSTFGRSMEPTGLPERVLNTISEARAPSTRRLYALKWSFSPLGASTVAKTPLTPELAVVLSFLQELLDKGHSHSTLKVFVAAIAAFHCPYSGPVGRQRQLSCPFSEVSQEVESTSAPYCPYMGSAHCTEGGPNDSKVILKPRHGYVPKVLSTPFRAQVITLSALPPSEEDRELSLLCPVRALRIYFERSAPFRHTEQLFVSFGNRTKGHPVTKQRLSKWIVDAVMLAYSSLGLQCPIGVRAHSTRGIASSWAWSSGVSITEICTAAGWATPSTFARFYNLDIPARVLSA